MRVLQTASVALYIAIVIFSATGVLFAEPESWDGQTLSMQDTGTIQSYQTWASYPGGPAQKWVEDQNATLAGKGWKGPTEPPGKVTASVWVKQKATGIQIPTLQELSSSVQNFLNDVVKRILVLLKLKIQGEIDQTCGKTQQGKKLEASSMSTILEKK